MPISKLGLNYYSVEGQGLSSPKLTRGNDEHSGWYSLATVKEWKVQGRQCHGIRIRCSIRSSYHRHNCVVNVEGVLWVVPGNNKSETTHDKNKVH